jgi:hypothetical protein
MPRKPQGLTPPRKRAKKRPAAPREPVLELPVMPSLDEPSEWVADNDPADYPALAEFERLHALALHHAETGEPAPEMVQRWPTIDRVPTVEELAARSTDLATFTSNTYYWRVYTNKLAARYLREVGAVDVAAVRWELDPRALVLPPTDRHTLHCADGTPALSWRSWMEARLAAGERHSYAALLTGLERVASAVREAASAVREAELRRELEDARAKPKPPELRQGIGFLRATMQRASHVQEARHKMHMAIESAAAVHTKGEGEPRDSKALAALARQREELENRSAFVYQPLGWAERLVVHALAALAREAGLLEAHPYALQARADTDTPAPRVRVPFPGYSELARIARFETNKHHRFPPDTIKVVRNALHSLTTEPRFIQEPVRVQVGRGKSARWVDDVRTTRTLWVEASTTTATGHAELLLHPVAVASHLYSYVPAGDLAARYAAARRAIGRTKMLDEYAACDDYLRYLASVQLGKVRGRAAREAREEGATEREAADTAQTRLEGMVAAGDLRLERTVLDQTLREALKMEHLARDRGETFTQKRVVDALEFTKAMGTLLEYRRDTNAQGGTLWHLTLAYPAVQTGAEDPDQGLLFIPEGAYVEL